MKTISGVINYYQRNENAGPDQRYLTFYITGNPGHIEYYHTTLKHFHTTITEQLGLQEYDVQTTGIGLRGFQLAGHFYQQQHSPRERHLASVTGNDGGPFDLKDQINYVVSMLRKTTMESAATFADGRPPKVILAGHSIGSYILLEVMSRFLSIPSDSDANIDIIAGICLFPTVIDIAKSPTGRKVAVSALQAGWQDHH
jgi:hypothetical protein